MSGTAKLGTLSLGAGSPVRVMAAINVSPESFFAGSVVTGPRDIAARVELAVAQGADIVDIGAMSTAPYLSSEVPEETELARIRSALRAAKGAQVPISVDTLRASVADEALRAGATVVNDVSGLKADPAMAGVVRERGAALLAMAHSARSSRAGPVVQVSRALRDTLRTAERWGIGSESIVLDPGIGFFREEGAGRAYSPQRLMPWYEWDTRVLAGLPRLEALGRPLCVGVSRKSFLGKLAGAEDPQMRLPASLSATAIAVMKGASMVRTHDVAETVQAVRVAEAVLRRGPPAGRSS